MNEKELQKRRRRRWPWILLATVTGTILLLLFLRYEAIRRVQAEFHRRIEALREAGEMVDFTDFAPEPIPPGENAMEVYDQAYLEYQRLPEDVDNTISRFRWQTEAMTPRNRDRLDEAMAAADNALTLARRAAAMPKGRVHVDYSSGLSVDFAELDRVSDVFKLLRFSARYQLAAEKPDEAVEDLIAAWRLSRCLSGHDVLIPILAQQVHEEVIILELRKVMDREALAPTTLARLSRVLESDMDSVVLTRVLKAERVFVTATAEKWFADPDFFRQWKLRPFGPDGVTRYEEAYDWAMRSKIYADALRSLDYMDRAIDLAKRPFQESRESWDRLGAEIVSAVADKPWRYPMTLDVASLPDVARSFARSDAERRIGRSAVALRRYRLKNGRYPDKLADLVPEFLEKVPVDPMNGKELIYRREGDGFVVYSVGEDGMDDGGTDASFEEFSDRGWKITR